MSAGCMLSSDPHPCEPGALMGRARIACLLTLFASILLVGLVVVGSPLSAAVWGGLGCWGGAQALGVGGGRFAILFGGSLGRTPVAAVATAWLAIRDSGGLLVVSPRHTFLWVCSTEEETKACFKHFPQL